MTHTRYAFVKANWHSEIVDQALKGFLKIIPQEQVDVFDVPGAFELPLTCKKLAETGKYSSIVACAFVVDGGIYRHEFVAQAVVNGLMQAGLETGCLSCPFLTHLTISKRLNIIQKFSGNTSL